jgi:hypothetical protein
VVVDVVVVEVVDVVVVDVVVVEDVVLVEEDDVDATVVVDEVVDVESLPPHAAVSIANADTVASTRFMAPPGVRCESETIEGEPCRPNNRRSASGRYRPSA